MMNIIEQTMRSEIIADLGWTLLHSLWQGCIIFLAVILARKCTKSSDLRYAIAAIGMLLLLTSSVITLFSQALPETLSESTATVSPETFQINSGAQPAGIQAFRSISTLIQSNLPLMVVFWLIGIVFFSLRLAGGWWYVSRLRAKAEFVSGEWQALVNDLAQKIGITRAVSLAQSRQVAGPVVIGYLKPVILIPAGMLTGLSTAELETIFIHELAHIKRHDYLVNLLQSLLEIIFFFNPFMWLMSGAMRKEREFACDDTVIAMHTNALVYARALAHLEESRISAITLGLSLAKNKNELLNRIKRIMEKSMAPTTGRDKIVVVTLMLAGLLCASWLTISTDGKSDNQWEGLNAADTTIKNKKARSQKMRNETKSQKDREESKRELPVVAPVPEIDEVPVVHFVHPVPIFDAEAIHQERSVLDEEKWERFSAQFEEKFQERFRDFYEKHQTDIGKMMQELQEQFRDEFSEERMAALEASMAQLERFELEHPMEVSAFDVNEKAMIEMENVFHEREVEMEEVHEQNMHVSRQMEQLSKEMELQGRAARAQMEAVQQEMRVFEKRMKEYEQALHAELIKDGYFSKGQDIDNIHWNDDNGEIRINGVEIKEKDRKKYRDLHKKFFREMEEPFGTPQ